MALTALHYLVFAIFPAAMAYAGASDLLTMTISNKISLALIAAFVALAPMVGTSWADLGLHLAAGGIVFAAAFVCFAFGWVAGGDVKLAAVAALWLGFDHLAEFVGLASILGGALTLMLLSFRTLALPAPLIRQEWVARLHAPETGVPYGIALAAAALAIYPASVWANLL